MWRCGNKELVVVEDKNEGEGGQSTTAVVEVDPGIHPGLFIVHSRADKPPGWVTCCRTPAIVRKTDSRWTDSGQTEEQTIFIHELLSRLGTVTCTTKVTTATTAIN